MSRHGGLPRHTLVRGPDGDVYAAFSQAIVQIEPATFRCRACGGAFLLRDAVGAEGDDEREAIHFVPELAHAFMTCPTCRSPDFEIVAGRGVAIEAIDGEVADA